MKKRVKICLFHFLCLMGLEGLFEMILFDHYMRTTLFSILFYTLPISLFISISTQLFKKNTNFVLGIVFYGFLGFWFSLEYIYNKVFQTFFSVSLFQLSDQILAFGSETILAIFKNLPIVILFFMPLILFILLRNQLIIGKNIIYITAESFHPAGVSKEVTPTLHPFKNTSIAIFTCSRILFHIVIDCWITTL